MAKFKLSAGQEIDILTAGEVRGLLREWQVDVAKGLRPINFSAQGLTDGSGNVTLGGATTLVGGQLGPLPAFWWSISRLAVRVRDVAVGAFSLYHGVDASMSLVRDVPAAANGFVEFGNQGLLVGNADSLVITLAGSSVSAPIIVSGQAIEIPQALLWRWLT